MKPRLTALNVFFSVFLIATPSTASEEGVFNKLKGLFNPSSPNEVITNYLKAQKIGDFSSAYELLSDEDKSVRSKAEYVSGEERGFKKFGAFAQSMDYKVLELLEAETTALAKVEVTHPDLKVLMATMFGAAMSGNKSKTDQAIADKLASGDIPMATTISDYNLRKEEQGWRVYRGYRQKDRIESLTEKAKEYEKAGRFDEAIKTYDAILAMRSESVEIPSTIERRREKALSEKQQLAAKAQIARENASYISNVKLYEFLAKYFSTYSQDRVPGVTFKLRNEGDKTLDRVEVTVFFKDKNGTTIAEETYNPVLVSKYSYSRDNKPLKPGYIWQIEKGKFFAAKSVPSEWLEGSANARITAIEISRAK